MRPAYDLLRPTDRRHRPGGWLHPYIRRLRIYRRRLRAGDPRIAASASLLGILLAATLSLALNARPAATGDAPVNRLAEAGPPRPAAVRMLDAAPRSEACQEQTWPYIAQNCLKPSTARPQASQTASATPNPQTEAPPAKPEAPGAAATTPQAPEPGNAPQQFASAQDVPLPLPRPQLEDDDELDQAYPPQAYPPDEPRRLYGPQYGSGYDPRGYAPPPYAMQDPRWRDDRRLRNYDDRSSRRVRVHRNGIRIGDFYFRF